MAEKKTETKEKYSIAEVTTATELTPLDNESGKAITQLSLLVKLANDISIIKKNLVG